MILSQAPAFQAQNPLGSPGVDFNFAEHQAAAVLLERNVSVLDQPIKVRAAQVQVTRDLVNAESPVGHWAGASGAPAKR